MQATLLSCKKDSRNISLLQNLQLKKHYSICSGCKLFAAQSSFISANAKYASQFSDADLSAKKIQAIKEKMIKSC